MAGARGLWRANGMKEEQIGKPVIAIVNSFTQFVPGHVHLHEIGQEIKKRIEEQGCFAAEFDTIAIDDGIAMGHDGMLYSLPSRDMIAVQCALCGCDDLYFELRQGHSGHAYGCHASEYPDSLRLRRSDGSRKGRGKGL